MSLRRKSRRNRKKEKKATAGNCLGCVGMLVLVVAGTTFLIRYSGSPANSFTESIPESVNVPVTQFNYGFPTEAEESESVPGQTDVSTNAGGGGRATEPVAKVAFEDTDRQRLEELEELLSPEWRDWQSGTYSCRAVFVSKIDRQVSLRKESGKHISVSVKMLAPEDVEYVDEFLERKEQHSVELEDLRERSGLAAVEMEYPRDHPQPVGLFWDGNRVSGEDSEPAADGSHPDKPALTQSSFRRIENGMTFEEVVAVLGSPGFGDLTRPDPDSEMLQRIKWKVEGHWATCVITFQYGKVVARRQNGIR